MLHVPIEALEAGLPLVLRSPVDRGRLELIVRRPSIGQRELVTEATLDPVTGLIGDTWHVRPSIHTPDRSPHPGMQLNVMNARMAALVAGPQLAVGDDRRALAGDQLYLDLDLSVANLPEGSLLQVGATVIEVTDVPHIGCAKFSARFGRDALRFVNSAAGRRLRLRGFNARIVVGGTVRTGDVVTKVAVAPRRSS